MKFTIYDKFNNISCKLYITHQQLHIIYNDLWIYDKPKNKIKWIYNFCNHIRNLNGMMSYITNNEKKLLLAYYFSYYQPVFKDGEFYGVKRLNHSKNLKVAKKMRDLKLLGNIDTSFLMSAMTTVMPDNITWFVTQRYYIDEAHQTNQGVNYNNHNFEEISNIIKNNSKIIPVHYDLFGNDLNL